MAVLGALTYFTKTYFNISIWYIVLFGIGTGVIFGKVFCRLMCPIGFIMELFMGGSSQFASMYLLPKRVIQVK
jgi:polyferredoxin